MRSRRLASIVNAGAGRGNSKIDQRPHYQSTSVIKCPDAVIAVGGDGTVNRVANGIMGSAAALAVIPNGSGSDFASLMRIPLNVDGSCRVAARGVTTHIDIGRFSLEGGTSGYFLNTLGIGFNTALSYEAQNIRWMKGVPLYVAGIARTLR